MADSLLCSEPVGLAAHARPVRGPGGWFVFVGDTGYWDSSFVLLSWN